MTSPGAIPWTELDTVFFDAGNTFLSMDFDRVAAAAADLGFGFSGSELERAEAAARPAISAALAEGRSTEGGAAFGLYLEEMLRYLPSSRRDGVELASATSSLADRLFSPGRNDLLWNRRLPGRREALERIRALGLSHGRGQQLRRHDAANRVAARPCPSLRRPDRLDRRRFREARSTDLRSRARDDRRPAGAHRPTLATSMRPTSSAREQPEFTPFCSTPGPTGRTSTASRWPT